MKEKLKENWKKIKKKVKEDENVREKGKEIGAYALMTSLWIYLVSISLWSVLIFLPFNIMLRVIPEKFNKFYFRFPLLLIPFFITMGITSGIPAFCCLIVSIIANISFSKKRKTKEWIVGGLIPIAVLVISEILQGNFLVLFGKYFYLGDPAVRIGSCTTFALVFVISWMFIKILNNKRIGYIISISFFMLLSVVNFFTVAITDQAFTFGDLKIATTAMGVLSQQQLSGEDLIRLIPCLFAIAGLITGIVFVYKDKEEKRKLGKILVLIPVFCLIFLSMTVSSKFLYNHSLQFRGNLKYGFIANFYITLDAGLDIPSWAKDYAIEDENDEITSTPNVIVIMNEAFSDLGRLYGLSLNKDPLEYYHSLIEKYPNGTAYSSVKGNNTVSSEWEFLSGTPTGLTGKGAAIYQDNKNPMRSIVSLFNSRGYTTIGLHPYHGVGYNRKNVYKNLGFDQAYFLEDLPGPIDEIRGYATDEYNYQQLIRLYEENENKGNNPFFCFNITMQNHGGYASNQLNTIYRTEGTNYSDLSTYLSVLSHSDEALKTLISYFENVEEDTIILIYGDHHPLLDNAFYEEIYGKSMSEFTTEDLMDVYAVPYLIWANYDLNEEAAPEEISINYLSNILFEVGNIPKSTWLHMIDGWQEEYPVVTTNFIMNKNGVVASTKGVLNALPQELSNYQKYSYGVIVGKEKGK